MANLIRGEVKATVGDVEITLVATMDGLAQLSAATGRPSFEELYRRLASTEIDTTLAAVRLFAVRGVRRANPLEPESKDKLLDYAETMQALSPLLDIAVLMRLKGPLVDLLSALLSSKPNEAGTSVPNG